jgi:DNA-binding Xre family transcriptional regulator
MLTPVGKARGVKMFVSYNKLWKILIDKKMNRRTLRAKAGISTASIAKLGKGENITTDVLLKICAALNCDITDIMEIERENTEDSPNG